MRMLNRLYNREQRSHLLSADVAFPCAALNLLGQRIVHKEGSEIFASRLLGLDYMKAILAGRSYVLSFLQSLRTSLQSVRDAYKISLRLQCVRSRCGRRGLAECATTRLGPFYWFSNVGNTPHYTLKISVKLLKMQLFNKLTNYFVSLKQQLLG